MLAHIGWFFLIFMFFSYTSYVSKNFPKTYKPISPIVTAAGIIIALWIAASAIKIVNLSIQVEFLTSVASFIESSLGTLFYLLAVIGYVVLLASAVTKGHMHGKASEKPEPSETKPSKGAAGSLRTKRIYRSGRERILGGVCGGIAEYLGIDPVIVRILWVLFSLTYGTGILAYIIFWIIIPRNPNHKWE
jgi:phage shock protein PspC (stress-responsive transcriptional regulator)